MAADTPSGRGPVLRVGLVGKGISGSLTPAMHAAEGRAQGLNLRYDLIDTATPEHRGRGLADIVGDAVRDGFIGLNITHPYKEEVVGVLDTMSAEVRRLGAANTLAFRKGSVIGHNTDHMGFVRSFERALRAGPGDRVLLLGAGGAGSAVAFGLLDLGVKNLVIHDRARGRAVALAQKLLAWDPAWQADVLDDPRDTGKIGLSGLVDATPMGMPSHPGTAFPPALLRPDMWVMDIVYFPLETELLTQARAAGCQVVTGAGMAVWQAVLAFGLFTGKPASATRMQRVFAGLARQRGEHAARHVTADPGNRKPR